MIPLKLSAVKPDFESILLQLQLYLKATGTWVDLQTSSTGQTLMEMMAAVAAFNQFAIESAARETTLVTAVRDSSVYAITRMLGVRIHRKSPANVSCNIVRKSSTTTDSIATFTQFNINGVNYFNRSPLMFVAGSLQAAERLYYGLTLQVVDQYTFKIDHSVIAALNIKNGDTFKVLVNSGVDSGSIKSVKFVGNNVGDNIFQLLPTEQPFQSLDATSRISLLQDVVRLYEGTIVEETFTSDGSAFQQIYLSTLNFGVSDTDIEVRVYDETGAATIWTPTPEGMWVSGPYDQVYFDSTSGTGEAIIAFGDNVNGAVPKLGNTIKVRYAKTSGATANNGLTNLTIAVQTLSTVSGLTVSVISGGANEKPASYYRTMAPLIFKARNRGVTASDYKAVALDYPGIVSVSIATQKDIAPSDLRWMNMIQMCVLPADSSSSNLTPAEWDDFLLYMEKKKHAAVTIIPKDPTKQLCDIDVTLALKTQYVVSSVVPVAEAAVRALFKRQSDSLGRRIPVSDVTRALFVDGVDYVVINGCKLDSVATSNLVTDLIPLDNTHFLDIGILATNTKYSERDLYA